MAIAKWYCDYCGPTTEKDHACFMAEPPCQPKGQSKKMSLMESLVNIIIGYTINFTAQIFIFPLFGVFISVEKNLEMGVIFTVISIVRSYSLRRMFNLWHNR